MLNALLLKMFNNKQDVAAQGLPDGLKNFFPPFPSLILQSKKQHCCNRGPWIRRRNIGRCFLLSCSPSLCKYRGRSEPTFRQEEVFFKGMVRLREVGEGGLGGSLSVSFAKWLPGKNLWKPLVSTALLTVPEIPPLGFYEHFYVVLYIII